MQGTSADDFFQTDRDLAIAAERARKQQRIAAQQQPLLLADRARAPLASFNIKSKPLCWAFVRGTFRAVIGESGHVARVVDMKSGKSLQLFRGHSGPVTCIEIQYDHSSSTGETPRCVFTGSWDKTVKKFDFETGAELATFKAHSDFIKSIVLMPASAFPDAANLTVPVLVSASSDSTIRVWTTAESSSTPLKTWKSHTRPVESLAVYTDSITSELTLCSASSDTTIRKWDVGSGTVTSTFNGHLTSVNGIKIHESIDDGELTLWSFSADKTAKRWDLETGKPNSSFEHPDFVTCICIFGSFVITGCRDEKIRIFDVASDKCINELDSHFGQITCLHVFENTLWSAALDCTVLSWDLRAVLSGATSDSVPVDATAIGGAGESEYHISKDGLLTEEEERELAELMDI